jgi:hypothetical protein
VRKHYFQVLLLALHYLKENTVINLIVNLIIKNVSSQLLCKMQAALLALNQYLYLQKAFRFPLLVACKSLNFILLGCYIYKKCFEICYIVFLFTYSSHNTVADCFRVKVLQSEDLCRPVQLYLLVEHHWFHSGTERVVPIIIFRKLGLFLRDVLYSLAQSTMFFRHSY